MNANRIHLSRRIIFLLLIPIFISSCLKGGKGKCVVKGEPQEPMIYALVDKYINDLKVTESPYSIFSTYGYDSLYINISINFENNDTLLTIFGSPYEEYYCMYEVPKNTRSTEFFVKKDSVFLIKRGKESIILYMAEPEQKPFLTLLTSPSELIDIRDYVINYFPEEYIDGNACTYIYHQDNIFELLRPTD